MLTMSKIEREYLKETVSKLGRALDRIDALAREAKKEQVFRFKDETIPPDVSRNYLKQTTKQNNPFAETGYEVKLQREGLEKSDQDGVEFISYRVLVGLDKFELTEQAFSEMGEIRKLWNILKLYTEETEKKND